jgi:hypothetical protein
MKSLKIKDEYHRKLRIQAAQEDREIQSISEEAFDFYWKNRNKKLAVGSLKK